MKRIAILTTLICALIPAGRCLALDVLINQVGYEPNSPKIFRVQKTADYAGDGTFSVKKVSDNSVVYSGTLTRKGSLWDKWYWQGDFSSVKAPTDYYVSATVNGENGTSFNFNIGSGTRLNQTGVLDYQYFTAQRCGGAPTVQYFDKPLGINVTWHHALCHLDDGNICISGSGSTCSSSGPHWDGAGGWHDAGDYNKFPNAFAGPSLVDLLWDYDTNRSYYDGIDVIDNTGNAGANGIPDIIDEALWQARWLAKMVDSTNQFGQGAGHIIFNTRRRKTSASFIPPEQDSDNVIGTSDDRWLDVGNDVTSPTPQEIVCCDALIKMHRILASRGMPTENFAIKALDIWNHKVQQAVAGGHNNLGAGPEHVWSGLDLYAALPDGQLDSSGRPFDRQDAYNRVLQKIDEMCDPIIANPAYYDSIDLAEGPGKDLGTIAWFARNYPATAQATKARTAIVALMTHYISLADDPIGLIRRQDDTYGGGVLQYFPTNTDWNGFFLGINRLYLYLSYGAMEAYKVIGDPAYLRFAEDQYSWVMGANYDRVCQMDAAGSRNPTKYHNRYYKITPDPQNVYKYGKEPGVVPNGYVRVYSTGLPNIDMSTDTALARYQSNEGWLVNNGAYAQALNAMDVYTSSAQIVADTIPSTMYAGSNKTVTVTVKNTGYIPWTYADSFRLGAVNDSDPFAPGRIDLAGGDSIGASQQKVFSFTMTAPSTTGTYTSDWRMVQEGVNWFGDTLTKQVQVTPPASPPGPVTSFAAVPSDQQISLSWTNPSESYFVGTMIRYKTTGYPTGIADGTLLVDRTTAPGLSDSYVHTNLTNGVMYYYRAFPYNDVPTYNTTASVTVSSVPSYNALWMNQQFDPFVSGNLGGQGNWTTTAAESQVQSALANPGKALLLDAVASGTITNNYAGFTKRTSGTPTVSFDVAQSYTGTSTTAFGAVVFLADDGTEVARFDCIANSWRLEYGSGSVSVLQATVTPNTFYTIKINFDLSQRKMAAYVNGASRATSLSFKTGSASNIASIRVTSSVVSGLTAQNMYLDNLRGETAPASPTAVTDDGVYTGSLSKLHCAWTPGGTSATEYQYAIGTTMGGSNIVGWTNVGSATEVTKTGLSLSSGATYYFAVQAGNSYGTWTSSINSNGIKTPSAAVNIQDAKALADGSVSTDNRAIRGKLVSAVFPGYFYIQEPDGDFGMKALSSAAVSPGYLVDLAGLMKGSNSERYIDCTGNAVTVTIPTPIAGPYPVSLANAAVGGVLLNSRTPGVMDPYGPNNIGLLVVVCGKVTQRKTTDPKYFYIDDGCGLADGTTTNTVGNVGLRVVAAPTAYPAGSYVAVTGISTSFLDGGVLKREILPVSIQILKATP